MARHRTHSVAFKRPVSQNYLGGETLRGRSKRHDPSRNLIRIRAEKDQAGALDEDAAPADLLQVYGQGSLRVSDGSDGRPSNGSF